jgi:transcriptional regulator with XRE-family HTH domain
MIFEKKKIQIETLGEYLRAIRTSAGLSLEEVGKRAQISVKFLEFLEAGQFQKLPPDVYVFGFLRELASLYGTGPQVLLEQYRKERGILQQVSRQKFGSDKQSKKFLGKLVVTPAVLGISAGVLFVALTVGYIVVQIFSINRPPALAVFEPTDKQIIKDSFVNVQGQTDPGIMVTVNGQDVFVDKSGRFKTQLGVTAGPRNLEILASNKFGKQTGKTISIVGESSASSADAAATSLQLRLEFTDDVSIAFGLDDASPQSISFHSGDSKLLKAQKKAVISTSDAGATRVTLNGQPLGALGRAKEPLANIPFFAENDSIK